MTAGRIDVGMWGWCTEPWTRRFYPEDLPEEWRLAYYANEFRCVYVPASYLADADAQTLEGWCAEVKAPFQFVLELPRAWSWRQARERLTPLLPLTAFAVHGEAEGAACAPMADAGMLTSREALWTPQRGRRPAGCVLGLIQVDAPVSPRALRGWVADFAGQGTVGEASILVFTGGPPALDTARQARLIAELIGL